MTASTVAKLGLELSESDRLDMAALILDGLLLEMPEQLDVIQAYRWRAQQLAIGRKPPVKPLCPALWSNSPDPEGVNQ